MKNGLQILFLRFEGLAILVASLASYKISDLNWWWLVIGLFVVDISMAGYLANNKVGAYIYNFGHSLTLPLIATGAGYFSNSQTWLAIGLIWLTHIGMDRALGFGLKSPKGFHHTHLGVIGKEK